MLIFYTFHHNQSDHFFGTLTRLEFESFCKSYKTVLENDDDIDDEYKKTLNRLRIRVATYPEYKLTGQSWECIRYRLEKDLHLHDKKHKSTGYLICTNKEFTENTWLTGTSPHYLILARKPFLFAHQKPHVPTMFQDLNRKQNALATEEEMMKSLIEQEEKKHNYLPKKNTDSLHASQLNFEPIEPQSQKKPLKPKGIPVRFLKTNQNPDKIQMSFIDKRGRTVFY